MQICPTLKKSQKSTTWHTTKVKTPLERTNTGLQDAENGILRSALYALLLMIE
jgi:hypothetical protein